MQLLCCGNLMQVLNIILSEFDASIDYNVVWIWCKHWLLCCLNFMQALTIISVYFDRCWTRRMSNGTAHMNGPSTGKYIDTIGKWKASPPTHCSRHLISQSIIIGFNKTGIKNAMVYQTFLVNTNEQSSDCYKDNASVYQWMLLLNVFIERKKGSYFYTEYCRAKILSMKRQGSSYKLLSFWTCHFLTAYIMDQGMSKYIYTTLD